MDNGLIPYRYAKALYKYALQKGNAKEMYGLMKRVIASFESNPELQKALSNPFIKDDDKEKLLLSAAGSEADDAYRRFVKLILSHRRADYAFGIMLAFRNLYRKENHISRVVITTAARLDDAVMMQLRDIVTNSFKGSIFEFSEFVNPDLIGGFVIDVDSVRMDASVSNELEQLRQTLLRSK